MANKLMFAKSIIDSDAFLDMPATTQLLYFHLSMRADDDGFVNNPKKIQRMVGCSDDDLKLLMAKSFIIAFESGVIVIKHWKIHNYIRNDTYNETLCKTEKKMLCLDENKEYQFAVDEPSTDSRRAVDEPSTQVSLVKVSSVKDSLYNNNGNDDSDLSTDSDNLSTRPVISAQWVKDVIRDKWNREATENDITQAVTQLAKLNYQGEMLANALDLAAQHGSRAKNWNYVVTIIDNWINKGYKTEEDVLMHELNRKGGAR